MNFSLCLKDFDPNKHFVFIIVSVIYIYIYNVKIIPTRKGFFQEIFRTVNREKVDDHKCSVEMTFDHVSDKGKYIILTIKTESIGWIPVFIVWERGSGFFTFFKGGVDGAAGGTIHK